VAEKIRVTLAEPYRIAARAAQGSTGQVEHRCTASIGVEMFVGGAMSEVDILKRADAAMYEAKEHGRNAVRFHEEKQHAWDNPQLPATA
jgi:diguanylate cyclase (GGDEF)-like protein